MGFHLKAKMKVFIKFDYASVIFKNTDTPIILARFFAEETSSFENSFFKQVLINLTFEINSTLKGFMRAMFRPSLSDGFQFNIIRIFGHFTVMLLNREHFFTVQRKAHLLAKFFKFLGF